MKALLRGEGEEEGKLWGSRAGGCDSRDFVVAPFVLLLLLGSINSGPSNARPEVFTQGDLCDIIFLTFFSTGYGRLISSLPTNCEAGHYPLQK